jgi:transposase InsO family protein
LTPIGRERLVQAVLSGQTPKAAANPTRRKPNGKAEGFIQTTHREWASAQAYPTSDRRARKLPFWMYRYNWHRPHGGIKSQTPISRISVAEDNLLRLHT